MPCEHAMWYVLPQIRAELARELVRSGMSQREAAEKLGITPAAVSQYLHKKRGGAKSSAEDRRMIEKAALEIRKAEKQSVISDMICACCKKINTAEG